MQRGVGIVEQLQRGLRPRPCACAAAATSPGARTPRRSRRRSDARRAAAVRNRPAPPDRVDAAMAGGEGLERLPARAPGRDIAPPCPECPAPSPWCASAGTSARSASACAGTNRSACSRSIDDGRRSQRQHDIGQDVERQRSTARHAAAAADRRRTAPAAAAPRCRTGRAAAAAGRRCCLPGSSAGTACRPRPRSRPACRRWRRARWRARQNSPPKNAGANCAIAANDNRPIAASWVLPSAR